jgi:hypothetical protein
MLYVGLGSSAKILVHCTRMSAFTVISKAQG